MGQIFYRTKAHLLGTGVFPMEPEQIFGQVAAVQKEDKTEAIARMIN